MDSSLATNSNTEVQIEVSSECFLNCIHCSKNDSCKNLGYSPDSLFQFLLSLSQERSIVVVLTGGEPILATGVIDLLKGIRKISKVTMIGAFTSGVTKCNERIAPLPDSILGQLSSSGLSFSYISLYSKNPLIHDRITGVIGSWAASISTISTMRIFGIDPKIHYVVNKLNIDDYANDLVFFSTLGVSEIRILRLVKHGSAKISWDEIGIEKERQEEIARGAINRFSRIPDFPKITISSFPHISPCRPFFTSKGCPAGESLLYILNDGRIFPCACAKHCDDLCIGNVSENPVFSSTKEVLNDFKKNKCLQDQK